MKPDEAYPPMPALYPKHATRLKKYHLGDGYAEKFLRTHDIKGSKSSSTRVEGEKSGEVEHLQSNLECQAFYIWDECPNVIKIEVGVPADPEETWRISCDLGVEHHSIAEGLIVPTLDFLLHVMVDGKEVVFARDVKTVEDMIEPRTLEKLEIMRVYQEDHRGIDYRILTEETIHVPLAANLAELRKLRRLKPAEYPVQHIAAAAEYMGQRLGQASNLSELALDCDRALGSAKGRSLTIAQHLIITRVWQYDLRKPFEPWRPGICQEITPTVYEAEIRLLA